MTVESESAKIRGLFASDGFARQLGVELTEVGDASVTVELTVTEDHLGWHGRCHGGVLFTLADIAMSYIGNRHPEMAYATHAAVDFVGGVEVGDRVIAAAHETVRRGRAAVCDVTLTVDGEVVAAFRGNTLATRARHETP